MQYIITGMYISGYSTEPVIGTSIKICLNGLCGHCIGCFNVNRSI